MQVLFGWAHWAAGQAHGSEPNVMFTGATTLQLDTMHQGLSSPTGLGLIDIYHWHTADVA